MTIWFVTLGNRENGHPVGPERDSVQETGCGQEPSTLFKAKPRCQSLAEARLTQAAVSMPLSPCACGTCHHSPAAGSRHQVGSSAAGPQPSALRALSFFPLPTSQEGCGVGSWLIRLGIT